MRKEFNTDAAPYDERLKKWNQSIEDVEKDFASVEFLKGRGVRMVQDAGLDDSEKAIKLILAGKEMIASAIRIGRDCRAEMLQLQLQKPKKRG